MNDERRRRRQGKKDRSTVGQGYRVQPFQVALHFHLWHHHPGKLAHRVCLQLVALAAASDDDIRIFSSIRRAGMSSRATPSTTWSSSSKPKVWMIATGWAASAGSLIFVSVPKERRLCLPNTRFLLHQPSGGTRHGIRYRDPGARDHPHERALNRIYAAATGQPVEKIAKDTDRGTIGFPPRRQGLRPGVRIIASQSEI